MMLTLSQKEVMAVDADDDLLCRPIFVDLITSDLHLHRVCSTRRSARHSIFVWERKE